MSWREFFGETLMDIFNHLDIRSERQPVDHRPPATDPIIDVTSLVSSQDVFALI
ncbi:MAG: hypothetical protein IPG76_24080 [Acidobacteria bacterium]|nr:hypothetical protein [Acidobacteriota bacterium]